VRPTFFEALAMLDLVARHRHAGDAAATQTAGERFIVRAML